MKLCIITQQSNFTVIFTTRPILGVRTLGGFSSLELGINKRTSEGTTTMKSNMTSSHRLVVNACITIVRYFGVWSLQPNSSPLLKILNVVYGKIILTSMCIFGATLFADLYLNYNDLKIVIDDGCFLAGISMILSKNFNFHLHQVRIQQLINAVHNPVEVLCDSSDPSVIELANSVIKLERVMFYFLTVLGGFLIVAMTFLTPTENGSLPIRAEYPFDTTVQPMHSVAFAIQAIAIAAGILTVLAMDAMVLGFCRFLQFQLQVLAANYENCQSFASPRCPFKVSTGVVHRFEREEADNIIRGFIAFDPAEVNESDDSFLKRFKICVKHHKRLIGIVDEMNELFSASLFVQLCASFSMICLAGFQALLGANGNADLMKYAAYLSTAFSQLLCWCWFGNTLTQESASLAESQWSSGWENEGDFYTATCYVIVSLMRTRKPMQLRAGQMYTMSMDTFIMILRGSYSFFAVLSTMSGEDE